MPKASAVFPYGIVLRKGGRVDVFPAANVSFLSKEGEWLSLFLVIDSGATISALPKDDAEVLGIHPESGARVSVSGVGGAPILGWRHILNVRLGGEMLKLPVVFLNNPLVPRVLGREGVFDRFIMVFDEEKRRSGCAEVRSMEARSIRQILDRIDTMSA